MQHTLNIEEVSQSKRLLKFTVDKKEVSRALDKAYRKYAQKVRQDGYRKGKTPRWLLERKYGKSVEAEVKEELIQESYLNADIPHRIVGRPSVTEVGEIKEGKTLDFAMTVDIHPELTIEGYLGLEIPYDEPTATQEEIEASLNRKLDSKKRIQDAEAGKAIEEGDFVLAKFLLKEGEEEIANESGTMINVGSERFYPGLDTHLVGMAQGDEKSFECTIGENAILENLRNKECTCEVSILKVQTYKVPELNDELASEFGYEGGVAEFKAAVEEEIISTRKNAARDKSRVAILRKLSNLNDFEVPKPLVDDQLNALREELRMRRMYEGKDPRKMQFSEADLADLQERAEFAGKSACILSLIAKQEDIKVEDEDIRSKVEEIADQRGQTFEAIMSYIRSENAEGMLADRILEEKTLNWIFDQASLVAPETEEAEEAKEAE